MPPGHRKTSSLGSCPTGSHSEGDYKQMKTWGIEGKLPRDKQLAVQPMAKDYIPQKTKCEQGCKHLELISYKVHKDQFKSLLVPSRMSGVFCKTKNDEKATMKRGRKPSLHSDRQSQTTDQNTFSSE